MFQTSSPSQTQLMRRRQNFAFRVVRTNVSVFDHVSVLVFFIHRFRKDEHSTQNCYFSMLLGHFECRVFECSPYKLSGTFFERNFKVVCTINRLAFFCVFPSVYILRQDAKDANQ